MPTIPQTPIWKGTPGQVLIRRVGSGFSSDGEQGKVIIFDLKTLKVTGEAKADRDADCAIYNPFSKRVFVMNGDPHSSTVIDAKSGGVVGTIELGGGLSSRSLRLFSAGREPQMLLILDSDTGKVLQSFPISGGVDAVAYEPETELVFTSTREGKVHVLHEDSPDIYSEVETIKTEVGAKTVGLDTKTHKLFLDTADFAPAPAPTAQNPHPQGTAIPGTFHVLVYGRRRL